MICHQDSKTKGKSVYPEIQPCRWLLWRPQRSWGLAETPNVAAELLGGVLGVICVLGAIWGWKVPTYVPLVWLLKCHTCPSIHFHMFAGPGWRWGSAESSQAGRGNHGEHWPGSNVNATYYLKYCFVSFSTFGRLAPLAPVMTSLSHQSPSNPSPKLWHPMPKRYWPQQRELKTRRVKQRKLDLCFFGYLKVVRVYQIKHNVCMTTPSIFLVLWDVGAQIAT